MTAVSVIQSFARRFILRKNSMKIVMEDEAGGGLVDTDLVQGLGLRLKDGSMPAAREERRIRSEEEAVGPYQVEGAAKDAAEVEVGLIAHPVVGAGGVEVDVGAKIAEHEHLAEKACTEV